MKAIEVRNILFQFLENNLTQLFNEKKLPFEILWHSNLKEDNNSTICRVYVNRRIINEEQDTLSTDVVDHGRVRYNTIGACVVSFFIPRTISNSYSDCEWIAQNLKNQLRRERFDCFWVRDVTATPYNMENNSYRYDVSFGYEFDEIV